MHQHGKVEIRCIFILPSRSCITFCNCRVIITDNCWRILADSGNSFSEAGVKEGEGVEAPLQKVTKVRMCVRTTVSPADGQSLKPFLNDYDLHLRGQVRNIPWRGEGECHISHYFLSPFCYAQCYWVFIFLIYFLINYELLMSVKLVCD